MMRALLLPGMDGTGDLLDDFVAALSPDIEATVVRYPVDRVIDYEGLTDIAQAAITPGEPFLIIAESFSGPIAIQLAARRPAGLVGIAFCASFGRTPRIPAFPLPSIALRQVVRVLPKGHIRSRLVSALMMGRWSTPSWRRRISAATKKVAPSVLQGRLLDALDVDALASLHDIEFPILCLRARRDRLVSKHSADAIHAAGADVNVVDVDAPHFMLQAASTASAEAVIGWCETHGIGLGEGP